MNSPTRICVPLRSLRSAINRFGVGDPSALVETFGTGFGAVHDEYLYKVNKRGLIAKPSSA
jgi:hypothetical protein